MCGNKRNNMFKISAYFFKHTCAVFRLLLFGTRSSSLSSFIITGFKLCIILSWIFKVALYYWRLAGIDWIWQVCFFLMFFICGLFHKVRDIQPRESWTEDETNVRGFLFCPCVSSHLISHTGWLSNTHSTDLIHSRSNPMWWWILVKLLVRWKKDSWSIDKLLMSINI